MAAYLKDLSLSANVRARLYPLLLGCFLLACTGTPRSLSAQPSTFGAADDPAEHLQTLWWQRTSSVDVLGGLSLIGPQWRALTSVQARYITPSLTTRLEATMRAGYYGNLAPFFDEYYDALRIVEFARYDPPGRSVYARAGPIRRMRLGTGHLVNFFSSAVAWEDRTVGAEVYGELAGAEVGLFTDNLLMDGVTGGQLAIQPLQYGPGPPVLRSLQVRASAVTDLNTWKASATRSLTGYSLEAQVAALQAGTVHLAPFVSLAAYRNLGRGLGFGIDLRSQNFIDLARFRLRLAHHTNSRQFLPGYIGAFYPVNNPRARILNASMLRSADSTRQFVGTPLSDIPAGRDFVTELRLLFFESFELWYYFRRHYGGPPLSEYHFRLFVQGGNQFRLSVGQDRGGLEGILSLFDDLGDRTALVFSIEYRLRQNLWTQVRARYTYEPRGETDTGIKQYLVERHFEPMVGVRLSL